MEGRASASPRLFTAKELAKYIGVKVDLIYFWRKEGKGPKAVKIGTRALRWRREDIERWLDEQGAP